MIHSTKREEYWSFWCQEWSNHQDQQIFWWNEAVEVFEAIEVVEAVEVIEAAEVLRPGKSPLRTSESSMSLNSAIFGCFEKKKFWVESRNIPLNFSTFSVGGWWGQPMLFFWKLDDKTQMVKPPKPTIHHNSKKFLILLPLRAIYFRLFHYETPCSNSPISIEGSMWEPQNFRRTFNVLLLQLIILIQSDHQRVYISWIKATLTYLTWNKVW